MKKMLYALLVLPLSSFAATYTGYISAISMNNNGKQVFFEVVDQNNIVCQNSWFKVLKPGNRELSPAELVVNSYYGNSKITVHSPNACNAIADASVVNRVTVGTSSEEIEQIIRKIKGKKVSKN